MLALHVALLSRDEPHTPMVLRPPGIHAAATEKLRVRRYEAASDGLRNWLVRENEATKDGAPELHQLFRAHHRARLSGKHQSWMGPGQNGAQIADSETEDTPKMKCIDSQGERVWCSEPGAKPAPGEATHAPLADELDLKKRCVDANGKPAFCNEPGAKESGRCCQDANGAAGGDQACIDACLPGANCCGPCACPNCPLIEPGFKDANGSCMRVLENIDEPPHEYEHPGSHSSRSRAEPGKGGCARSCQSGGITHLGVYPSYLFYADHSRAGLSDRAWVLGHVTALANALCARPAVRPPYKMLGTPHNHDKSLNPHWWWDRYFGGVESLFHFGDYPGTNTCPARNRTFIGPSRGVGDVERDLAQVATATEPFTWCLDYNIRSYLGSGGFDGANLPHDWCTMPEAWLGGSEDATTRRKGEMALGPSRMVEDLAFRVTETLGLSHWGARSGAGSKKGTLLFTDPLIARKRLSVAPTSYHGGPCTAHYGGTAPCCGQDELDLREDKDVQPCPQAAPTCVDYVYHKHMGRCMTVAEAQPSAPPPSPAPPPPLAPWEEPGEAKKKAFNGRCTAHHGESKPCCGQVDTRDVPDVRPCHESMPVCVGYTLGAEAGRCEKPKVHNGKDTTRWLYVLHVRRTDTVFRCDTSVPAVQNYLRCPAARFNETANHKLVFFTDESDPKYLRALTSTLSKMPRWGAGVIHGDQIIRDHIDNHEDREDNYLVYSVASLLMSHADELYAMERCSGTQGCGNIHLRRNV